MVARYYCRTGQTTFSLLPDCLASRLSSTLDEVEQVVAVAETAPSQETAAAKLRPDIELPGALRWLRLRVRAVQVALLVVATLLPGELGDELRVGPVREHLQTERALVALRELASAHLGAVAPPLGFGPRSLPSRRKRRRHQHDMGPDPPPEIR
jgi:hypothetical protein